MDGAVKKSALVKNYDTEIKAEIETQNIELPKNWRDFSMKESFVGG